MISSCLSQAVDSWSIQTVVASRYLMRLYRALGDGKQAATAAQIGVPSEERVQRLRLTARVAALWGVFAEENTEETQREAHAWQTLVEAQAGISALHSMDDGHSKKSSGLQGAKSRATKAFHRSLQGYRVAFPEEIANAGIFEALQAASGKCTEACLEALGGEEGPEERSEAATEIHKNILEALLDATDLKTANGHGDGY